MAEILFDISAEDFDTPDVNPAPLDTGSGVNGTIKRRLFDDTTELFVIRQIRLPLNLGAGNVNFEAEGFAVTWVAGKLVAFTFHHSVSRLNVSWDTAFVEVDKAAAQISTAQDRNDLFTWNATVASLGWIAGDFIRVMFSRNTAAVADNLVGDWGGTYFRIKVPVT